MCVTKLKLGSNISQSVILKDTRTENVSSWALKCTATALT